MPALFLLGTYQDSSTKDDTTHIKDPACVIPRAVVARGPLPLPSDLCEENLLFLTIYESRPLASLGMIVISGAFSADARADSAGLTRRPYRGTYIPIHQGKNWRAS